MASFLVNLASRHLVSISGEQRDEYLHGQLTVNTKQFDAKKARITAHCDFKGKMWSVSILSAFAQSYHMLMPQASAKETLTQLKKYGVFSKVAIEDTTAQWRILGGSGEAVNASLQTLFPDLTNEHLGVTSNTFGQVITFDDTTVRYLVTLNEQGFIRLRDAYADSIGDDETVFELLEIEAGLAFLQDNTVGEFVPQMLNLQALNAIDFDKGCYMGQEVVARTKFLGKNKRATYILSSDKSLPLDTIAPGATLEKSVGENFRRGGTLLTGANGENGSKVLAVLANDTQVGDVLRLKDSGEQLTVLPLPYSLEN
ncbi:tRNA-modifying protein YgfZ [Glaciecola sp. XM2]|jgi:folate-binding protein YgfZ|uniref:CAF17-like 4Fe-4S cluster assembly/insertion protein YgfZ n=1 Tax=Glaciecola sp. XM2 TaxID=1914931 RepID=UPI001BDF41F6|nr:tRNA-modifying protein YgfZ [Glaciecola sp. XM2]MBT1452325.1 tRNA-modifying protein YgfZ [Glaciecola sp. XM2]